MLIAVDTNVPLDLAGGVEDVADALAVIRQRIKSARLRDTDYQRLKLLLQDFHVAAPIVATPREIVQKFFC